MLGNAPGQITHRDHPHYRIATRHGEMPGSSEQHPVERLSHRGVGSESSPDLGTSTRRTSSQAGGGRAGGCHGHEETPTPDGRASRIARQSFSGVYGGSR